ncbi:MAG: hypothetical protein HC817_14485 [Saprospiraceae bacterium]|nr:hypothetical protein [Saprospiraceae bacterium]
MTGSVPNFSMPVLKHLYINDNQLSGVIPNFSTPQLGNIQVHNNNFVFGDMANNTFLTSTSNSPFVNYTPQKKIPLSILNGILSVSTGEPNTVQQFEWYKDGTLVATNQNNQYQPTGSGVYKCKVSHNTLTVTNNLFRNLVLESEDFVLSVLPVDLLSFKAINTEGGILLTWQTAGEKNAQNFDLERSVDGFNFKKIAEIPAKGQAAFYEFLDENHSNKQPIIV